MHAKIGATDLKTKHSFCLVISSDPRALLLLRDLIGLSTPFVLISILMSCSVGIFGNLDGVKHYKISNLKYLL